jgi:hypothetical protein
LNSIYKERGPAVDIKSVGTSLLKVKFGLLELVPFAIKT